MPVGFFMPIVSLFGVGCVNEVGARAKILGGNKALIVTDAYLAKNTDIVTKVKQSLADAGLDVAVFDGAEPNPTDKNVETGIEIWNKEKCDLMVSVGGGSSHDCAKGIAMVVSNGGVIKDYSLGVDLCKKPLMPYLAVNTTSGTGSELTRAAVITDTSRKIKMVMVDWRMIPDVAFNDPELLVGMPPSLTAATGMDAMTHAIEAYVVPNSATPLTDITALGAIKMIAEWLPKAVANGTDLVAREKMAYAAYIAGIALSNAFNGYVHAMAHQPGSHYNLPHGVCNAILLPIVSEFNIIAKAERYRDIAIALGENVEGLSVTEAAYKAIEALKKFNVAIGIPSGFKELGLIVNDDEIEAMAKDAMADPCASFNPKVAILEDIVELYKKAM
jgi:alcohol dehydrogenase